MNNNTAVYIIMHEPWSRSWLDRSQAVLGSQSEKHGGDDHHVDAGRPHGACERLTTYLCHQGTHQECFEPLKDASLSARLRATNPRLYPLVAGCLGEGDHTPSLVAE